MSGSASSSTDDDDRASKRPRVAADSADAPPATPTAAPAPSSSSSSSSNNNNNYNTSGTGFGSKTFADLIGAQAEPSHSRLGGALLFGATTPTASTSTPTSGGGGGSGAVFGSAFTKPTFAAMASPDAAITLSGPGLTTFGASSSLPTFSSLATTSADSKLTADEADTKEKKTLFGGNSSASEIDSKGISTVLFGSQSVRQPSSPTPDVPHVTGEEHEKTVVQVRAKLHQLNVDKIWRERGVGLLKLNVDPEKNTARLLMRADGSLRLVLNVRLFNGLSCELLSEKMLRMITVDSNKQSCTYAIKTHSKEDAIKLRDEIGRRFQLSPPKGIVMAEPKASPSKSSDKTDGNDEDNGNNGNNGNGDGGDDNDDDNDDGDHDEGATRDDDDDNETPKADTSS